MDIAFLYGTESGNAQMLCEDLEAELDDAHTSEIINLADVDPGTLSTDTFYILVSSTYGNGDLPSTAIPFEAAMLAAKPDLSGVRFAVFGLGDQMFADTYNHGSQRLAEMMTAQNAQMVGARETHDASSLEMPEDIAIPWMHGILEALMVDAS